MKRVIAILAAWSATILGLALLVLNVYGVLVPMRSPIVGSTEIADDPVTVTPDEFFDSIQRREDETEREWVGRATRLVDGAIGHWWSRDGRNVDLIRVPLKENFVLWTLGVLIPDSFGHWEFVAPDSAVQRGIGLCSQSSMVLTSVLRDGGVDAQVMALDGHVVVAVRLTDGREIVADPDFGLVLDHSREELQNDRALVTPLYRGTASPKRVEKAIEAWNPQGNRVVGDVKAYHPGGYWATPVANALKWLIPPGLIVLGVLALGRMRNKRGATS